MPFHPGPPPTPPLPSPHPHTHSWLPPRWLYPFLDVHKPYAPVAYLGLYLVHWLAFGFASLLVRAKGALLGRLLAAGRGDEGAAAAAAGGGGEGVGAEGLAQRLGEDRKGR